MNNNDDYSPCNNNPEQNYCICKQCDSYFVFDPDNTWWNEQGTGYSTKLVKCAECENINVVKYIEDYGLDVNNDMRFYNYKRRH